MRTLEEISREYTMFCAQLGDFEVKVGHQKKLILEKIAELEAESAKVKEVQAELDKQKAEAEAKAAKEVADAAPLATSEAGATS